MDFKGQRKTLKTLSLFRLFFGEGRLNESDQRIARGLHCLLAQRTV